MRTVRLTATATMSRSVSLAAAGRRALQQPAATAVATASAAAQQQRHHQEHQKQQAATATARRWCWRVASAWRGPSPASCTRTSWRASSGSGHCTGWGRSGGSAACTHACSIAAACMQRGARAQALSHALSLLLRRGVRTRRTLSLGLRATSGCAKEVRPARTHAAVCGALVTALQCSHSHSWRSHATRARPTPTRRHSG